MIWSETFDVAMRALRANKVRALLTMLGVMVASACIVLVVTIALSGKRYIVAQIEGVGANIVYAALESTGSSQTVALSDEITVRDMEAVEDDIPQVRQVAGTRDVPMMMVVHGVERPVNLVGVTKGFQSIRNLVIVRGRFFGPEDMETHSKVCLLTQNLASLLFPDSNPVGQQVRIGDFTLTVIGVFRERIATFGQSEITGETAIVPLDLVSYFTGQSYIRTLYAQADRADDVPIVTRQVSEILQSRHRVGPEYRVQNLASILETAQNISMALTIVLLLIAFIALAIGGIGIMNVMLITVTERTREIGVRMAVGARRREILYQFLFEAIILSGTGAIAGVAVALGIRYAIGVALTLFDVPADITVPISWLSVALALCVCCATGLFFGYLPASRAARLHPTEALHYE
jgi:putative ABC transport system permease protein